MARRDDTAAGRLRRETGTISKDAPLRVALVYPSPYRAAMSSLGYQTLYRVINDLDGVCCERAVLESPDDLPPLRTLESESPVGDAAVVALSVATEAEAALAARALVLSGIEPLEERRRAGEHAPLVVAGGPLTWADGAPLAAIADVVLCGEGEDTLTAVLDLAAAGTSRDELIARAAGLPGALVPSLGTSGPVEPALAGAAWLPARSAIVTPDAELGGMFLVEAVRGCPRRCAFCVMERSRFRPVPAAEVLAHVPPHARRVGIVGAALLDHPEILEIVGQLVDSGRRVSLSSLRADRLDASLLELLARGGARTLTVAADGGSERLRRLVRKGVTEDDLMRVARDAAQAGLRGVKLYAMVGLPTEQDEDVEELCRLAREMSRTVPVSLAVSPFVPKARTSLADEPFAPLRELRGRISFIRKALHGRVEVLATSVRAAWVEQAVARGGLKAGLAAVDAARDGCTFGAWRTAIERFDLPGSDMIRA
jgi:radical SAM superfamily enzyme YgiQ (UPF0313 family)